MSKLKIHRQTVRLLAVLPRIHVVVGAAIALAVVACSPQPARETGLRVLVGRPIGEAIAVLGQHDHRSAAGTNHTRYTWIFVRSHPVRRPAAPPTPAADGQGRAVLIPERYGIPALERRVCRVTATTNQRGEIVTWSSEGAGCEVLLSLPQPWRERDLDSEQEP